MNKPIIVEKFADNGEHSHWSLVNCETGELLWSEAPEEEMKKVKTCNKTAVMPSLLPCEEAGCQNPHEKAYRGCDICKFKKQ